MPVSITQNVSLKKYTTLGMGGEAEHFVSIGSQEELKESVAYAKEKGLPVTVLGGGSNALVSDKGVQGLVIHMNSKGVVCAGSEDKNLVLVTAQAGELLDDVVALSVSEGLWGIENLSHIPGTVGATPVQNVGAYGVEVKDVIAFVTVLNTETNTVEQLQNETCAFAYRDSLFKKPNGKKYIIISVTFILSSLPKPKVSYRDLAVLYANTQPSLTEIRASVIAIRSQKFPNWHEVGTAGSFFKNPTVTKEKFELLKTTYPELPGFESGDGAVKLSLGWILDKVLHLKGYSVGPVATYEKQALVLVVQKEATAAEIIFFAEEIIAKIKKSIDVVVESEVTFLK